MPNARKLSEHAIRTHRCPKGVWWEKGGYKKGPPLKIKNKIIGKNVIKYQNMFKRFCHEFIRLSLFFYFKNITLFYTFLVNKTDALFYFFKKKYFSMSSRCFSIFILFLLPVSFLYKATYWDVTKNETWIEGENLIWKSQLKNFKLECCAILFF